MAAWGLFPVCQDLLPSNVPSLNIILGDFRTLWDNTIWRLEDQRIIDYIFTIAHDTKL